MSIGFFSRWVFVCAAIASVTPSAVACAAMDDWTFALRSAPPKAVQPDEIVQEIDRATTTSGKFLLGEARFEVKRELSGTYSDKPVLVAFGTTSCDQLAGQDTDSFVVGRIARLPGGKTVFLARSYRLGGDAPELKAVH